MNRKNDQWSIRIGDRVIFGSLSEDVAWNLLLHHVVDPGAEIIYCGKIMAKYNKTLLK